MMDWVRKLTEIEGNFGLRKQIDWRPTVELIQQLMAEQSNNVELTVRVIYILHNIIVEEEYSDDEHDVIAELLKKYFNESYQNFSENSEYLFFVGKILYVAEWYFGLDEDFDPVEKSLAFKMQEKAFNYEPDNKLYEWACAFSRKDMRKACELSRYLLFEDTKWLDWLRTKGYPGRYSIESLMYCHSKCDELSE